jgi:tRNA1Val (adenine37-N6)-methyltransferase
MLVNDSIQNYAANYIATENEKKRFDIIITNPPFYEGDLKSPDTNKNKAAHSTELSWASLVENSSSLLKEEGHFFVLVPTLRAYTMQKLAEASHLYLREEVLVYNDAKHLPFRSFLHFEKRKQGLDNGNSVLRNKIVIKNTDNSYSPAFTELLKDYYLYL